MNKTLRIFSCTALWVGFAGCVVASGRGLENVRMSDYSANGVTGGREDGGCHRYVTHTVCKEF
jgi:hypothetical protein